MYALKHVNGCGGICYYRTTKPELGMSINEKDTFNLDMSPVERTQAIGCQSCGNSLRLKALHPDNWEQVND